MAMLVAGLYMVRSGTHHLELPKFRLHALRAQVVVAEELLLYLRNPVFDSEALQVALGDPRRSEFRVEVFLPILASFPQGLASVDPPFPSLIQLLLSEQCVPHVCHMIVLIQADLVNRRRRLASNDNGEDEHEDGEKDDDEEGGR